MARAEIGIDDKNVTVISMTTSFAEKESIKSIPGSRYTGDRWVLPLAWASCLALRGVFGQRLEIGPMLDQWARNEIATRIDPCNQIRMLVAWANDEVTEPGLYPFQDVGVEFLSRAKRALLTDEMGTGKTTQIIRAIRRLADRGENPFPVCVVTLNTVKLVWQREWGREAPRGDPQVEVFVITGTPTNRKKIFAKANEAIADGYDVAVVINIESVRIHSRLAPYGNVRLSEAEKTPKELNKIPFRTVVVDEIHKMKDATSKQTRACWAVQHAPSVEFTFGASATPIANHSGELWPIMHGLAKDDYPTRTKYIDRYCLQGYSPFGGLNIIGVRPDTADEFYNILNPRTRRMPIDLVLPYLPRITRPEPRYVEMSSKQKKAYKSMSDDMVTRTDSGEWIFASNNLTKNSRLLQFSSAYAEVDESGRVRLSEPSSKLDELMAIIEEMDGQPLVAVAESKQLIDLAQLRMEAAGITYRMITGDVSEAQRQVNIDDFQNGLAQVMLMTIKAGGAGITLTRAGVIVFLQRSWSMIDNIQCEGRVHRIGSEIHDKIVVIDMIAAGTVEEMQIPKLHEKAIRLQEIVRDREVLLANGNIDAVKMLDIEKESIELSPLWGSSVIDERETE